MNKKNIDNCFLYDFDNEYDNILKNKSKYNETSFKVYFKNITMFPLLTKEEEIDLSIRYLNGDEEAKNILINSNLRLVVYIAKRYQNLGFDLMEIIQEGNIGLITAVEKFNPYLGYKFSTYATFWIKRNIEFLNKDKMLKVPRHLHGIINKYKKLKELFYVENGREITEEEIINILKISEETLKNINKAEVKIMPITEFDSPLESLIQGEEDINTDIYQEEMKKIVGELLNKLTEREQKIIKWHYGLIESNVKTLDEIGKELGVTRQRVNQIESKALKKIKTDTYSDEIKNLL